MNNNAILIRELVQQGILLTGPYRPRSAADTARIRAVLSGPR
jgi:hypothetical protein